MSRIRLLHRISVDWVADTFGLRGRTPASVRHEEAHARAYRRAMRANTPREHQPPRVLKGWQDVIGRAVTRSGDQG